MKKMLCKFLFVVSLILPIHTFAGPFYGVCYPACVAACVAGGIWMIPPGASFCVTQCPVWCGAACLYSCFDANTTIVVLEDGREVKKNIADVHGGDMVRTLRDRELVWTKVLKNKKTEGEFEFVQIDARNITDGNYHRIRVTPVHGMVLVGEDDQLTLDAADNMLVDDKIIVSDNDILSVTEVNRVKMQDRYTLETVDGTVLASGIFVSTICDGEIVGGEQFFDSKIEDWKERHSALIDENISNEQV